MRSSGLSSLARTGFAINRSTAGANHARRAALARFGPDPAARDRKSNNAGTRQFATSARPENPDRRVFGQYRDYGHEFKAVIGGLQECVRGGGIVAANETSGRLQ